MLSACQPTISVCDHLFCIYWRVLIYPDATSDSVIWTNSEITTTIVCVTIPSLRPLYRSIRGGSSSNDASYYNNITPQYQKSSGLRSARFDYTLDTLTTTTVHSKGIEEQGISRNGRRADADQGSDDTDTRHILNHDHYNTPMIHQVTEVDVSFEERRTPSDRENMNMPSMPVKARQHV